MPHKYEFLSGPPWPYNQIEGNIIKLYTCIMAFKRPRIPIRLFSRVISGLRWLVQLARHLVNCAICGLLYQDQSCSVIQ